MISMGGGTLASCNCNLTACSCHSRGNYYIRYELTPELIELIKKPPPVYEKVRELFSKYSQIILIYWVQRKSRAPPKGSRA